MPLSVENRWSIFLWKGDKDCIFIRKDYQVSKVGWKEQLRMLFRSLRKWKGDWGSKKPGLLFLPSFRAAPSNLKHSSISSSALDCLLSTALMRTRASKLTLLCYEYQRRDCKCDSTVSCMGLFMLKKFWSWQPVSQGHTVHHQASKNRLWLLGNVVWKNLELKLTTPELSWLCLTLDLVTNFMPVVCKRTSTI